MKTPRTALVALVAGLALSACAGPGVEPGSPGTTPTSPGPTGAASVTSQPSPDPSGTPGDPQNPVDPTPAKPGGPSKPPGPGAATLTGTVQAGVEPNCLLLDGNLLVGGPRDVLTPGARVTVTGHPQPDMMTTCQQGTPFVVESARRA
ncbi:hypothetical protein Q2K19_06750 [Micromonospora soli]|uniref:hypothetical protein n=1 Tax=Micromonospora sp. NBRC 110009 TaxID=3061627 RepID=UPI0026737EC9|nr:hypothetical protein [Micromonospora sp. NBRC 110009]WKU00181.1 hypothetical protein Q2K19_06750 [Micromonospora sp. NBRC 110009]